MKINNNLTNRFIVKNIKSENDKAPYEYIFHWEPNQINQKTNI